MSVAVHTRTEATGIQFKLSTWVTLAAGALLVIGFAILPYMDGVVGREIPVTDILRLMPFIIGLGGAALAARGLFAPQFAQIDSTIIFVLGIATALLYHVRSLTIEGQAISEALGRTGLGFWATLLGAVGFIVQYYLPKPEADDLARRNAVGVTWKRFFSGANVIALVALVLIAGTIINQTFGLVAVQYTINPHTLSDKPLEELSSTELVTILNDQVPNKLRVFIRDTMSQVATENFTKLPINQVLNGKVYPAESATLTINDLTPEVWQQILVDNLSQSQLLDIVNAEVVKPQIVASWMLWDSLTQRPAIEEEVAAKYEGADIVFRSWVNSHFITSSVSSSPTTAGLKTALLGSLWIIGITVLVAFPIGIGAAIYLEEYADKSLVNRLIEINIRNLAGVPSIIYGILGLAVFVRILGDFTSGKVFGVADTNGRTVLSAALTMALLILPVIIINAQEAIRAVPSSIREASMGIGATKWQTIWRQILPASLPGIMTGIILSMSRAVGETAPLIVVGASTFIGIDPSGPFSKFTVVPIQIYQWTSRPELEFKNVAAAAIIVLLVLLVLFNGTAIIIRQRYSRRLY